MEPNILNMSDFYVKEKDGITYIIERARNKTAITKIVAANLFGKKIIAIASPKHVIEMIHNKLFLIILKKLQIPETISNEMKIISGEYDPKTKEITWGVKKEEVDHYKSELMEEVHKNIIPKKDLKKIKIRYRL